MAVRRWMVRPNPGTGMVDRDELVGAIMDGEALLWRAGGVLTILVGREPTDLPGEMVTTEAVIEWKDRTDAKSQPERGGAVIPVAQVPAQQPAPEDPPLPVVVGPDEDTADIEVLALEERRRDEEEDLAEIPVEMR